jgi:hypothetical protein
MQQHTTLGSIAQQCLCKHGDYATVKRGVFSAVRLKVYKRNWNAFGLLLGFSNHLQVVTTITYNTLVGLHTLQTLHTNLFTLSSV